MYSIHSCTEYFAMSIYIFRFVSNITNVIMIVGSCYNANEI